MSRKTLLQKTMEFVKAHPELSLEIVSINEDSRQATGQSNQQITIKTNNKPKPKQMEIQGRIIKALDVRSGVSERTGKTWMTQQFVIETHEQYPKRCVFSVFGEDRLKQFDIKPGDELIVSFDIDAREYQGRWYNDIQAWRVMRPAAAAPVQQPMPQGQVTPQPTRQQVGKDDDLPF